MNHNIKRYLAAYNTFALVAWLFFFGYMLSHGMRMDVNGQKLVVIAQCIALAEIAHAALGWAGSNWVLAALQITSRILVVGLIYLLPIELLQTGMGRIGAATVTLAWGITEVVRYTHYRGQLADRPSTLLNWLRYTLFIGLYPIGVAGEFAVMYAFVQWKGLGLNPITIAFAAIVVLYIIFFPKLYGHMWAQRKKKLGQ